MKKTVWLLLGIFAALFVSGTSWAASFLTLQNSPLRAAPLPGGKVLTKAMPGWLLHASPAEGAPGWYAVSEFQKATGTGFIAVHLAYPESGGYLYVAEKDLMSVPDQGEAVFTAEDVYTPSSDSEGLVPYGVGNTRVPMARNSLQNAGKFDFGSVFIAADTYGKASDKPLSFSVLSIRKDPSNPWKYSVDAEVRLDGRDVRMDGTFTLKKVADFVQNSRGMKLAVSGVNSRSLLSNVPNGFVSADVDLREGDGRAALQGILTAYFIYEQNPQSKKLQVALNDLPRQQENPHYRNLFFAGIWFDTPATKKLARGGAHPLQAFPDVDGKLLKKLEYADSEGDKVVILTHSDIYPASVTKGQEGDAGYNADLYAYGYSDIHGDNPQRLWMMRDHVRQCAASVTAEFADDSPVITDLDGDGISEVWIIYYKACRGDVSPEGMIIHLFDGIRRFTMRGETLIRTPDIMEGGSYTMDPPFTEWPEAFREFAVELWDNSRIR